MSVVSDKLTISETEHSRIWRSKEARGIRDALAHYEELGTVSGFSASKLRVGRMTFNLSCAAGCSYRLLLDVDAGTIKLIDLLPGISERSARFRELKSFLRPFIRTQTPPVLGVDPKKGALQLLFEHSGLVLLASVNGCEYEYCTRRLLALADEIRRLCTQAGKHASEKSGTESVTLI